MVKEPGKLVGTFPLRTKPDADDCLIRYAKWFEHQMDQNSIVFHMDVGPGFKKTLVHFDNQRVNTSISTAYSPRSNGLAESTHNVLLSLTRSARCHALMFTASQAPQLLLSNRAAAHS